MTTQLESQRHYFEERIENLARAGEEERDKMRRNFEDLFAKERDLSEQRRVEELVTAERRANDLRKELEMKMTKEKEASDKKYQQVRRLSALVQRFILVVVENIESCLTDCHENGQNVERPRNRTAHECMFTE